MDGSVLWPCFQAEANTLFLSSQKGLGSELREQNRGESVRRGRERGPRGGAREEAPAVAAAPPWFTHSKAGRHSRGLCLTF